MVRRSVDVDGREWLVTYWGKEGRPRDMKLVANDRADVFRQLEAKQISAIKVELASQKVRNKGRVLFKVGIVAAIAAIGALTICMILSKNSNDDFGTKQKPNTKIVEVDPSIASQLPDKTETVSSQSYSTPIGDWTILTVQDVTNKTTLVVNQCDPDDPTDLGGTDQVISMIFSTPLGVDPVPVPFSFDEDGGVEDFTKTITNTIVITENDDAGKADRKMDIIESKLEMLNLISQGYTPQTVLKEAYELRVRAANVRNDMIEEIKRWILEDNPSESAVDVAIQQFNQRLEADGILTISQDDLEFDESELEEAQYE